MGKRRDGGSAKPTNVPSSTLARWTPLLLAVVAFAAYVPSLGADFVYDGRYEILREGFITSLANLPLVFSLKVMGMYVLLGTRPGSLLYLMALAAVFGKNPLGYHLGGNLLHAANAAMTYVVLVRLAQMEISSRWNELATRVSAVAAIVTLFFALHPLTVETVSEINYSSDLLVAFFTLAALLSAMAFRPAEGRNVLQAGGAVAFCSLAAVTCKESGIAVPLLLFLYWFLYRKGEPRNPWRLLLAAATVLPGLFLVLRFSWGISTSVKADYLGGSFAQMLVNQPRLWVFMMGKIVWPVGLSADYTFDNLEGLTTPVAVVILICVLAFQAWLAWRSRLGAMGVAVYWLALATVSNFIPLYRPLGDRFYYLSLVGVAMQLLALFLMMASRRVKFFAVVGIGIVTLATFLCLNVERQAVFVNDMTLWTETIRVSPNSPVAHGGLAYELDQAGHLDAAFPEYQKALALSPNDDLAHNNLGQALFESGRADAAIAEFQKALQINPHLVDARDNLANAYFKAGRLDEARQAYEETVAMDPRFAHAHYNLGSLLLQIGQVDQAIAEFQKAVELSPENSYFHNNLGIALYQKGQVEDAITQFQEALRLDPANAQARDNLAKVQAR